MRPSRSSFVPGPLSVSSGVLLLVALAGCAGSDSEPDNPNSDRIPSLRGEPVTIRTSPELEEIARLEDARSTGDGRLIELLSYPHATVRRRAALAAGRLPYPEFGLEVTEALCRTLEDEDREVRCTAAFALGLRADPLSAGILAANLNDVDATVRAAVVEAASRIPDPSLHDKVLLALREKDLTVKIEAAVGTARWDTSADNAEDVDRALLDALRPYYIAPDRTTRTAVEAELVWRTLFALSRRGAKLGKGPFLEYADSDVPLERLFALRGLARLDPEPGFAEAAARALVGDTASSDWRIAYEATVALGKFADPVGLAALEAATEHDSIHVRAGAMRALGSFSASEGRVVSLLNRGFVDRSTTVRNAALEAAVGVFEADDAEERIQSFAKNDDPVLRLGAARAAALLEDERMVPVLHTLTGDSSKLVATHAVEGLGRHLDPIVRAELHSLLGQADNGIRLAAVGALRTEPDASDAAPLIEAFRASTGDVSSEIAFNVLINLGRIGTDDARDFVQGAVQDPRPYVRRVAREVLQNDFELESEAPETLAPYTDFVPIAGKDYPAWQFNPLVEVATNKGNMVFELFAAEAPIHVVNFLELARRGDYDGLSFHRVVSDFVIQGGDYRGDGNGARPWRREALRQEFGARKFARGSLGMPRNQDVESGGSQFFVTHRPTPHLDGRYTIFGELRIGGEVLDRIEVGDRIRSVRILEDSGSQ